MPDFLFSIVSPSIALYTTKTNLSTEFPFKKEKKVTQSHETKSPSKTSYHIMGNIFHQSQFHTPHREKKNPLPPSTGPFRKETAERRARSDAEAVGPRLLTGVDIGTLLAGGDSGVAGAERSAVEDAVGAEGGTVLVEVLPGTKLGKGSWRGRGRGRESGGHTR